MATRLTQGTAPSNPSSLGFIKGTAGTPLQITSNYTDLANKTAKVITIQADPAITAGHYIYVLAQKTAVAADTTNGLNILAKLGPTSPPFVMSDPVGARLFLQDIWIDWSNTGDAAIASFQDN